MATIVLAAFGVVNVIASQSVKASDAQAIQMAVARAHLLKAEAARSFDTSAFVSAFADDLRVALTDTQKQALARFAQGTAPSGYLTYMKAYFRYWQQGDQAFERVKAARSNGVEPAAADLQQAIARRSDPIVMPTYSLRSIRIDGDLAYYEADTPATLIRMTLVNVGGTWLVAGEDDLAHP